MSLLFKAHCGTRIRLKRLLRTVAMTSLFTVSALMTPQLATADAYYRWVDKNGVTHYTTTPPKNGKSVIINTKTGGHKSASPFKESPSEQDLAQTKKKEAICATAKANLKTLQTSEKVKMTDEYGEEKVMSDKERKAELERAKTAIKEHCLVK